MRKRLGFTLIEVMVVMAIIAVLATAGISSYAWYTKRATDLKTEIYLADLNSAIIQFKGDHNGRTPDEDNPTDWEVVQSYIAFNDGLKEQALASLTNIFGVPRIFAQTSTTLAHPAGSKRICLAIDDNGNIISETALCEIVYYKFSDGKFAFSAGVRTKAMLEKNFHSATISDGITRPNGKTHGMFVGDSPIIARPEKSLETAKGNFNTATGKSVGFALARLTPASNDGTTPPGTTIPPTTPPTPTIPPSSTIPYTTGPGPITMPPVTTIPSSTTYPPSTTTPSTTTSPSTTYSSSTTDYPTTSWVESTTDVPSTTEGAYCFFLDMFCPESQYCDNNICKLNSEAELALGTNIPPESSSTGAELYCTWTIFDPFTPGNCMSYSTGLPTGEQCWIFDFMCTTPYGEGESSTTEYPTGGESTSGGYCDIYNGNQYDCENNGCYWDYNSYYYCFSDSPTTTYGEESSTTWY